MTIESTKISRRNFIKYLSCAALTSRLNLDLDSVIDETENPLIVRVHDSKASKPWNYEASAPWDHTVEPGSIDDFNSSRFRKDRYFDHINEETLSRMFSLGLKELAGTVSNREAWLKILKDYKSGDKITIKINLNNASYCEQITTNRMDQTAPIINSIVANLTEYLYVKEEDITVADPSRYIHPDIILNRCPFKYINWIDCRSPNLWDKRESVKFTEDQPVRPKNRPDLPKKVSFHLARVYTESDHIINVVLMKNHGCGVSGAMKNHFGAIPPPSPKFLHTGLGERSYIADLCNTESIKYKVRLNVCDAIFANWHNNVWSPRPWKTFPEESPNSLFLGADPVAFDSVLLQHITDEVVVQGRNAPKWVQEAVEKHQFLHYAMEYHRLGIHEHKPFRKIEYRQIENI